MNINYIDTLIFLISIIFTLVCTIILSNKVNNNKTVSYLLFSRKLTLPLFVMTLVSTWYGDILSVTQMAFKRGISTVIIHGIGFYISAIFFMIFIVEKARNTNASTLPEIIKNHYGVSASKIASVMIIVKSLPVTYLISIGVLIQKLIGINLHIAMLIAIIFIIICIGIKGLSGIIYSDAIQFFLIYFSVIMVIIFSFIKYGNYKFLIINLDAKYFSLNGNEALSYILMWVITSVVTTFISPIFYQRCFAAKNTKIAKRGIIISVIFWVICDLCTVIGSMYAKIVLPHSLPYEAYFDYALKILPTGFKGIFLSGIAATILSTLDSFLFICSSTLTYDLFGNKISHNLFNRIFGLLFISFLTFFLASYYINRIEHFVIIIRSYCGITIVIPLVFTIIFGKIVNEKQFIISVMITCLCMIFNDFIFTKSFITSFYLGIIVAFFNICFFILVNYLSKLFEHRSL